MGLFDAFTNDSTGVEQSDIWKTLTDTSQINPLLEQSIKRPQLIYKHSNRCSVCFIAKGNLEKGSEELLKQADMHYIDVVKYREVSNEIASELEVRHESPQVILIDHGDAIWHASHGSIESTKILDVLD